MARDLAKATIKILEGRNVGQEIPVIFNPAEYNLEISNTFQESTPPGLSNPIIQFVSGQTQVLTMDLLFDTYTDGGGEDVSKTTKKFADMLSIDGVVHAPPRVEFRWGVFAFKAVVEKLSQRFTMFRSDGVPLRATLNVSFKQYRSLAEQLEEPRRNSSDKTKRRVFTADDRLDLLADREYLDPRYWRLIAAHNDIEDPTLLESNTVLLLPPLEEAKTLEPRSGP
jgi:hypothetical protein